MRTHCSTTGHDYEPTAGGKECRLCGHYIGAVPHWLGEVRRERRGFLSRCCDGAIGALLVITGLACIASLIWFLYLTFSP